MPKIEINKVAEILQRNKIEPAVLRRIIEEINHVVQPDPGEENKPPPAKKQWVILVSDPEKRLPKDDFVGWVLQIPEDESPATTQDRIFRSVYDFNTSKRGPAGEDGRRSAGKRARQAIQGMRPLAENQDPRPGSSHRQ